MNNFNLKKFLTENKLTTSINETLFKFEDEEAKEYYKPLADIVKSMGYETNLKPEDPGRTQSVDSLPHAFLYYNDELPTEEEGAHKGKDVSLASLKGTNNSVNNFMSNVDPHPEDTKKNYDFVVNKGEYYAKSQDVLKRLENAMGDSVDVDSIKKLTSNFTSAKDFKPVTYYKMVMFPDKEWAKNKGFKKYISENSLNENDGYISKAEIVFHLKQYRDGNIDGDDLAQAIEEIIYGNVTPPGFNTRYGR